MFLTVRWPGIFPGGLSKYDECGGVPEGYTTYDFELNKIIEVPYKSCITAMSNLHSYMILGANTMGAPNTYDSSTAGHVYTAFVADFTMPCCRSSTVEGPDTCSGKYWHVCCALQDVEENHVLQECQQRHRVRNTQEIRASGIGVPHGSLLGKESMHNQR